IYTCPRGSPAKPTLPMTVSLLARTAGLLLPTLRLLNPARRILQRTSKTASGASVIGRLIKGRTFCNIERDENCAGKVGVRRLELIRWEFRRGNALAAPSLGCMQCSARSY